MAQWVKLLEDQPDDMSSILWTHMMESASRRSCHLMSIEVCICTHESQPQCALQCSEDLQQAQDLGLRAK